MLHTSKTLGCYHCAATLYHHLRGKGVLLDLCEPQQCGGPQGKVVPEYHYLAPMGYRTHSKGIRPDPRCVVAAAHDSNVLQSTR
jgi:hypothetical protein